MKDRETMQVLVLLMTRCNKRTEGCLTTSEVGRQMGLTPREMFRRLKRRGVIRYDKLMRCYMLHGDYRRRQLMLYRCCIYYSREGEPKMKQYPVWTPMSRRFATRNEMCYAIGDDGLPVMSEMPADTDWQGSRGREPRTETFNKEFVDENAPDQHLPWNFRKLFTAAFGSAAMLGCDDLRRRVKDLGGIKMNQYYDKVFVEAKRRRIVMEELTKNGRVGVILLPPS